MDMKKTIFTALICMLPLAALAAPGQDTMADQYFSKNSPALTPQEKAALTIGKKWQTGPNTSRPFAGADGGISYVYLPGRQVQVLCAVLQVCDVALQPGELVNHLDVGDPRFIVSPSITGAGPTQVLHLIIKPLDVGLDTTLVVSTNRRTYHFRLRSSRHDFMPFVTFTYPEEEMAKWDAIRTREAEHHEANTLPTTGEYLGNLDFHYKVSGSAPWKPLRVYNDGRKTIIEMPASMSQSEAPTLLVVRDPGGLFTKAKTQMVNYRVQNGRYIVDTVFDRAILIAGVGSHQDRVTITKEK